MKLQQGMNQNTSFTGVVIYSDKIEMPRKFWKNCNSVGSRENHTLLFF